MRGSQLLQIDGSCTDCGQNIDRDLNAAINLARQGEAQAGSTPVTGRGATQKTTPPSGDAAAGDET